MVERKGENVQKDYSSGISRGRKVLVAAEQTTPASMTATNGKQVK